MCQVNPSSDVRAVSKLETKPSMNINLTHNLLVHHIQVHTHEILKALVGITIAQGLMNVCEAYPIAKAMQKNTTHESQ